MAVSNTAHAVATDPIPIICEWVNPEYVDAHRVGGSMWGSNGMTKDSTESETYSDAETKARAEATLKRMLATPHKPHKASKVKAKESRSK